MLKKCLKYDLASCWRLFALMSGAVLAAAPIMGLLLRSFLLRLETMIFPWELLILFVYVLVLPIFCFVCVLLLYIRYYTNFFRDEGYLTFTLPVKRSTLLLSKILSAGIYYTAMLAVLALAAVIILVIAPYEGEPYHTLLGAFFVPLLRRIGVAFAANWWGTLLKALIGLLLALAILLFNHLFYYLTITLGASLNRKHPLLFCVLLIYLSQAVLSLLTTPLYLGFAIWVEAATQLYPLAFAGARGEVTLWLFLFGIAVAFLLLCVALWQWLLHLLEHRLNLA